MVYSKAKAKFCLGQEVGDDNLGHIFVLFMESFRGQKEKHSLRQTFGIRE